MMGHGQAPEQALGRVAKEAVMTTQFGDLLRHWREARKLSQLDLGLSANVSARHISFLETGRARPSRAMVLNLGGVLDVPRGSRNALLHAAGLPRTIAQGAMDEAEMGPITAALDWMLERHMPYPPMVLDRHWTIVRANPMAADDARDRWDSAVDANLIEALLDETGSGSAYRELAGGGPSPGPAAARRSDPSRRRPLSRGDCSEARRPHWRRSHAALGAGSEAIIPTRYSLGDMRRCPSSRRSASSPPPRTSPSPTGRSSTCFRRMRRRGTLSWRWLRT
jgi:transcriptional regulator with XRE-family HTH domain